MENCIINFHTFQKLSKTCTDPDFTFQCNGVCVCAGTQGSYIETTELPGDHNLRVHKQGEGAVKQKVDRHGQRERGGWKLAKMCRYPLRITLWIAFTSNIDHTFCDFIGSPAVLTLLKFPSLWTMQFF